MKKYKRRLSTLHRHSQIGELAVNKLLYCLPCQIYKQDCWNVGTVERRNSGITERWKMTPNPKRWNGGTAERRKIPRNPKKTERRKMNRNPERRKIFRNPKRRNDGMAKWRGGVLSLAVKSVSRLTCPKC